MNATRASRLQFRGSENASLEMELMSGVISKFRPGSPPPATGYMGLACINHTPTNHTFPPQRTQSADTEFTESKYPRSKSEPLLSLCA